MTVGTGLREEVIMEPMEEIEYVQHMAQKKRWSEEKSRADYARQAANPRTHRDHGGEAGALRLYLNLGTRLVGDRHVRNDKSLVQGSRNIRNATPEVLDSFKRNVQSGNSFFRDDQFMAFANANVLDSMDRSGPE